MKACAKFFILAIAAMCSVSSFAFEVSDYTRKANMETIAFANSMAVKYPDKPIKKYSSQVTQLRKTEDFGRRNYNEAIELSALNKIALVSGKNSREYLMAYVKFKLKQGVKGREEVKTAIDKACAIEQDSYECIQCNALYAISSSQMKMKLQNFNLYEEHKDYESAVDAMDEILGVPIEHELRYRYYLLMGNIPGRENESIKGLKKILSEIPYETNLTRQIRVSIITYSAQSLANKALIDIDNPALANKAQSDLALAIKTDPTNSDAAYWKEILDYSKYYRTIEKADEYFDKTDVNDAILYYLNAIKINPNHPYAYVGLVRAYAQKNDEKNFNTYANLAIKTSTSESASEQQRIRQTISFLRSSLFVNQAAKFEQNGKYYDAIIMYKKAIALDSTNPWSLYSLANCLYEVGQHDKALQTIESYTQTNPNSSEYAFAYALMLDKLDKTPLAYQKLLPFKGQDPSIDATLARFKESINMDRANVLYEQGKIDEAIEVLENSSSPQAKANLASLVYDRGEVDKAISLLEQALAEDPTLTYPKLSLAQMYYQENNLDKSRQLADELTDNLSDLSQDNLRALGDLYANLGDETKALKVYDYAIYTSTNNPTILLNSETSDNTQITTQNGIAPESLSLDSPIETRAWIVRNKALLEEKANLPKAKIIDSYREALSYIDKVNKDTYKDNAVFTRALRTKDEAENWLTQSVKANAQRQYLDDNIIISGGIRPLRDSGHGGYSDTKGLLSLINVSMPFKNGRLTVQADRNTLNAGSFTGGEYNDMFGTCFSTGCNDKSKHKKTHTSLAVGFDNDLFHVDIGTAPKISGNDTSAFGIVGGASMNFKTGDWTFTPEIYHRVQDNSVLSYFGDTDPNSGLKFGSVKKTGITLNASYYINEHSGIWSNANFDLLRGTNVVNNTAFGAMGGYYYHIIDKPNERLTLSPSIMMMKYQKDLSGYTFGQGGYYSPQQYISSAIALRYTRRHDNTSYMVEVSGSLGRSKTSSIDRYPIKLPLNNIYDIDSASQSESSNNIGGGIRGSIEQRITENLVIGATLQAIKAQDYSPINGMLFFRYYINDWNGDLNMPPVAPTPYVEW